MCLRKERFESNWKAGGDDNDGAPNAWREKHKTGFSLDFWVVENVVVGGVFGEKEEEQDTEEARRWEERVVVLFLFSLLHSILFTRNDWFFRFIE